jgi:hypothetical protein
MIDESDDEEHEQQTTIEYIDRIEKTRQLFSGSEQHGGVQRMNFKNILNGIVANKWTILGIAGVTGAAVLGQPLNVGTVEAVLEGDTGVALALAGQILAGYLAVKAAIGPGLETIEQAKAREGKALELKKAQAVNAEKLVIETKALKLAKQLGIDLEQAKTVVKAKEDKAKVDKAAEVAAKEKAIIVKFNVNSPISLVSKFVVTLSYNDVVETLDKVNIELDMLNNDVVNNKQAIEYLVSIKTNINDIITCTIAPIIIYLYSIL